VKQYNLQDIKLLEEQPGDISLMIWQPEKPVIVIGKSNLPEKSVNLELTEKDGVEVLQRMSGGETVLLSPKTMIISTKIRHTELGGSKSIFKTVNQLIINALEFFGCHEAVYRGISDIALGQKKILGSAMYKGKDYLFYHAVLNLAEDIDNIAKYILHPEREPDYRKGRNHKEFVTSLKEEGYDIDYLALKKQIERNFMMHFKDKELVINF
jgi:lipoate-protein ligase A